MILTDNQNQFKNQDSHYDKRSGGRCSRVGYLRVGNDGAISIVVGGCESHDGLGAEFPVELSLTGIADGVLLVPTMSASVVSGTGSSGLLTTPSATVSSSGCGGSGSGYGRSQTLR